jgi:hypothetical protein
MIRLKEPQSNGFMPPPLTAVMAAVWYVQPEVRE